MPHTKKDIAECTAACMRSLAQQRQLYLDAIESLQRAVTECENATRAIQMVSNFSAPIRAEDIPAAKSFITGLAERIANSSNGPDAAA